MPEFTAKFNGTYLAMKITKILNNGPLKSWDDIVQDYVNRMDRKNRCISLLGHCKGIPVIRCQSMSMMTSQENCHGVNHEERKKERTILSPKWFSFYTE